MKTLVFFLEELSAKEMLKGLLPRLVSPEDYEFRYVVFEGKSDLEKRLVNKLREWCKPDSRFVVLRDQDSGDCSEIKSGLIEKCRQADRPEALVRIACRELESWYLADLAAVGDALGLRNLEKKQEKAMYRSPDTLENPSMELERLTEYRYQKVAGSRSLGPILDLENTRSHSFSVFVAGIRRLVS